ncbi:hypothetical protein CGK40_21540 [Vibrio parahaemolyticus]|uniref:hypothetical protein n=1 Tax=Vibrio parahaemolyticus TaxID=670 RepID=UPI00111FA533|nr:hypothetical protein [Vibrio parahaemolyticus]TNZ89414.1 hypothetical protein CGK40_21540 [Vibrio parahaemolyticus]
MKKLILLLPVLLLSSASMAKVTYEDALESSQAYYDANAAVHHPPATEGLTAAELQDGSGGNEMGMWVKVSSTTTDITNAGSYATVLTPDAAGQACVKGTRGLIMNTVRECNNWNSGGWHCEGYGPAQISDEGYKAECK